MATIIQLPMLGLPFGQVIQTDDGRLVRRVRGTDCPPKGSYLLHIGLCHNTVETVVSIVDGQPRMNPIWVPNNVFVDEHGNYLIRTLAKYEERDAEKAREAGIGYLINRDDKFAEAIKDGEKLQTPTQLTNEMGVTYDKVDFFTYGLACRNLFGYVEAKKVEPVYLISDTANTDVNAVVNGVNEHAAVVEDGEVLVQNAYHGERYKQKRSKFLDNYEFTGETLNGYQVWKPKEFDADGNEIIQHWTFTEENVWDLFWGGFEMLAKAAMNVSPKNIADHDIYGCNYNVFNGDDTAKGSHKKLRRFVPANPFSYEQAKKMLEHCREDLNFAAQVALNTPKFVEVPLGVYEMEHQFRAAI